MKHTLLLAGILSGILLTSNLVKGETADRIVAIVNDKVITLRQLKLAEFSALQNKPQDSEGKFSVDQAKLLEDLIEEKLLIQVADKAGITVTEDEVNAALEEIKKRNKISDDAKFREAVTREGQSWEQFLDDIRKQIKVVRLVNREVRSRVTVDEAEVRDYYEKTKNSSGPPPEKVKVRHILFSVPEWASQQMDEDAKKKAEEVLAKIKGGLDFAEAARLYSDDPSKERGGDLGVVSKGHMINPLDEVIFSLKPGEVSQPVRSSLGYHLIKVEEKINVEVEALETAKEQIRNLLFQQKVESLYKDWIKKLKSEAYIEIKEEALH
ncbi:MAG TPA: peptidylprolyl isomerase [Candidatus Limnocylindrales bacterium]|nr:peptidylprolyl isomerase [Candidatus Limnocylindrales bacterium]